jgi:hypothetical protein
MQTPSPPPHPAAPAFCSACGQALEPYDAFCGGCGAPVPPAAGLVPAAPLAPPPGYAYAPAYQPAPVRRRRGLKITLLALGAYLLVGFVVLLASRSTRWIYSGGISSGWDVASRVLETVVWPLTATHHYLIIYGGHLYWSTPSSFHRVV